VLRETLALFLFLALAYLLTSPRGARARPSDGRGFGASIQDSTWTDHDGQGVPKPAPREPKLAANLFREAVSEQISHGLDIPDKILWAMEPLGVKRYRESVNINAFDEVPNSTWFTNRNAMRAVSPQEIRDGPFGAQKPETPWTVVEAKHGGVNPGFQIEDANGRRWLIKLDHVGCPQMGSGADVVSSRLIWAAGYNFSHDEAVTFRREDLTLPQNFVRTPDDDPPPTEAELDALLARGERGADGRYYAGASLFLPGDRIGPVQSRSRRDDDPNDWYTHPNRRELRALYVVFSWLNYWDVKDQQTIDMFEPAHAKEGHVNHYWLDAGASLGASAEGAKDARRGFEQRFDLGWIGTRFFTLGLAQEPWRRANQATGIPSVGNFEADVFEPQKWRPLQSIEPFRKMTPADAYWGAKLVASFSDSQIRAAIDAAGYEDPRAPVYLFQVLHERRDKVARYWFDRVAPLDYFEVRDGVLRFHDLAVDVGLTQPRRYEIEIAPATSSAPVQVIRLSTPEWQLGGLRSKSNEIHAEIAIAGSGATPVRLDLVRTASDWTVTRVRH